MVEANTVVHREPLTYAPVILDIKFGIPVIDVVNEMAGILAIRVIVPEKRVGESISRIQRIVHK